MEIVRIMDVRKASCERLLNSSRVCIIEWCFQMPFGTYIKSSHTNLLDTKRHTRLLKSSYNVRFLPECVWEAGLFDRRPPPGRLSGRRCWIWGIAAGRYRAESARKFLEARPEQPYGPHPPHLCLWCYSPESKLLEKERDLWLCVTEKRVKMCKNP